MTSDSSHHKLVLSKIRVAYLFQVYIFVYICTGNREVPIRLTCKTMSSFFEKIQKYIKYLPGIL